MSLWRSRAALLISLACGLVSGGCGGGDSQPSAERGVRVVPVVSEEVRHQLLDGAISVLRRLDEFREPAAYAQVFDRLNQWSHAGIGEPEWSLPPLLDTLPPSLAGLVSERSLAASVFNAEDDPVFLRDQRWLADLADRIRGDAIDDLETARRLFAWTVRSLAADSDPPATPTDRNPGSRWFLPGEILLSGRASPPQRAWIFLELLRHAGIDGVMLGTYDASAGDEPKPSAVVAWVPAVISGGEAWLFEPAYGIPIPAADGKGVASLREARENPAVLAALDVAGRRYPVRSDDLTRLVLLVPGTPQTLSRRMRQVEQQLAGANAMRVSLDVTRLVERAGEPLALDGDPPPALLWRFPWEVLEARRSRMAAVAGAIAGELAGMAVELADPENRRQAPGNFRPLFAGRVREFRGDLSGPQGAKRAYLAARPGRRRIREIIAGAPPDRREAVGIVIERMKEDATYWLGLLTLEEGEYGAAIDFLDRMTLDARPDGRWADAARVNVATAYAAEGRLERAIALLEADESPQRYGSRIRAERLRRETIAAAAGRPDR